MIQLNVQYGSLPANVLDLYIPDSSRYSPIPTFILFHGGGWNHGDKSTDITNSAAQRLYAAGYACANVNYRLLGNYNTARFPNPYEYNVWPTCLIDAQAAVCYMRAIASRYNLHTGKMISWGDSAGAHLAMMVLMWTNIFPNRINLYQNQSPRVNGAIGHSTPTDLTMAVTPGAPQNIDNFASEKALINKYYGLIWREASPLYQAWSRMGPVAFSQGSTDTQVLPSNATSFDTRLTQLGVPHLYVPYTGGHVFTGVAPALYRSIMNQCEQYVLGQL